LTVVNGNIELLEMKFSGDEEFDGSARDIKDSVERMTRLTAQLLAYARGGKYQVKTVSLGDFIKKALPLIKLTLASGIIVKADRLSETFDIEADLTQLQMVLSAVLLNASEALNENGCIQISCHDTTITDVGELSQEFPELEPGDYVCLTISDNGMGMDEKTLKQIFEPFFTTKFFGRGLGMAAAYGIIKNHNGWIAVDSEPGHGTTVEIYLPAAQKQKLKEPEKIAVERPEKGHGTILVVEDEEAVMGVFRMILKRLGYRILEAKTGGEAVDLVKTCAADIDLVLLDIVLPDMNGNIVYPLLLEVRPDLKVIVCSGYAIDGPAQEILDAGAQGFIQKPFSIVEFSGELKRVLEAEQKG